MAAEAWLLRNKLDPAVNAEEGASIRAVRRVYAELSGIPLEQSPEPKTICEIALGHAPGDRAAAVEAFRRLGEVAGDAMAQALTLIDGLAVIGGGIAGAHRFSCRRWSTPSTTYIIKPDGVRLRRLVARAFNIEDPPQREAFLKGETREIAVPGSTRSIRYDPLQRIAVGIRAIGHQRCRRHRRLRLCVECPVVGAIMAGILSRTRVHKSSAGNLLNAPSKKSESRLGQITAGVPRSRSAVLCVLRVCAAALATLCCPQHPCIQRKDPL